MAPRLSGPRLPAALLLLAALAGVGACTSAAASSPVAGSGDTCPCKIGNTGLSYTLGCGESGCLTLNGTVTGYRCDSDGAHVDPSACDLDSGVSGFDVVGPTGDGGVSSRDGVAVPDTSVAPTQCVLAGGTGLCQGGDCVCSGESCEFACGSEVDAGASIGCHDVSCGISCAGACSVDCLQAVDCEARLGAGAYLVCEQAEACKATVGDRTTVDCAQAGTCDVTCTGQCTIDCSQATSCRVNCAGGLASCDVTCAGLKTCADGMTKVCGGGC